MIADLLHHCSIYMPSFPVTGILWQIPNVTLQSLSLVYGQIKYEQVCHEPLNFHLKFAQFSPNDVVRWINC